MLRGRREPQGGHRRGRVVHGRDGARVRAAAKAQVLHVLADVRRRGRTLVAVHIRRGDAKAQNRNANVGIYVAWLRALWPTLDDPILFLATDDAEGVQADLAEFNPVTAEGIRLPIPETGFYPDFYMLTQADYLAAGDSTFSSAASMLNERAKAFVRPNAANTALEPFDPWNFTPTL